MNGWAEDNRELIDAAVEYADDVAGDDDAEFVRALRQRYFALAAPGGVPRIARTRAAGPVVGDPSTHIYDDPRYQANARLLARKRRQNTRVIGGTDVPAGEYMDCVAVGNNSDWGCTGTLIAPAVVLTAGHCSDYATRVYLGSDVDEPGRVVRVRARIRHPQYHSNGMRNDLMVLLLEEEIEGVAPRPISQAGPIDGATDIRIVGFGNTDRDGRFGYGRKRQVDVPVASPRCDGRVGDEEDSVAYGCDRGLELIAGKPLLARDSCTGDSGGPAMIDAGGEWLLAGAVSRATDSSVSTCGDGGVYVRVDQYLGWIGQVSGVTF
jgi:secreted trypsin-like serine protease